MRKKLLIFAGIAIAAFTGAAAALYLLSRKLEDVNPEGEEEYELDDPDLFADEEEGY